MADNATIANFELPDTIPFAVDYEAYNQFLNRTSEEPDVEHIVIAFPCSIDDPLAWLNAFDSRPKKFSYYWENPDSEIAIAACGSMLELTAEGPNRFQNIHEQINRARQATKHHRLGDAGVIDETIFVGGFSFFDQLDSSPWNSFKAAAFTLPEFMVQKRNGFIIASVTLAVQHYETAEEIHKQLSSKLDQFFAVAPSLGQPKDNESTVEHSVNASINEYRDWIQMVRRAKSSIERGDFQKVVLGRQLKLQLPTKFNPFETVDRLRKRYPKCATFCINKENNGCFIGCSPERLLSIQGNSIQTEALAGSIARGKNTSEDRQLEYDLLQSSKDQQEHALVVDHIQHSLLPFTEQLNVTDDPVVKKLANVQHLYTPVSGELSADTSLTSILGNLHPTPAVGGTPQQTALRYINENELFDRGWFAAPVGWITTQNRAEFSVAIRSGLIKDETAHLFAGCGIVRDSDPETEWQETNLKFLPMLSALNYD